MQLYKNKYNQLLFLIFLLLVLLITCLYKKQIYNIVLKHIKNINKIIKYYNNNPKINNQKINNQNTNININNHHTKKYSHCTNISCSDEKNNGYTARPFYKYSSFGKTTANQEIKPIIYNSVLLPEKELPKKVGVKTYCDYGNRHELELCAINDVQ